MPSSLESRTSVVVPAFDAARTIGAVVAEMREALPIAAAGDGLIVVCDGSTDGTAAIARDLGCRVIVHEANRGKGVALRTGFLAAHDAGFSTALTVDADGQHPGAAARAVLDASDDESALVLGVRDLAAAGAPRANRFSNGVSNFFISRFAGRPLADTQCGLRRYPIPRALELDATAERYAFEAEVILRAAARGVPIVEVPIEVRYPDDRTTHFEIKRDVPRIIGVVVRTTLALRSER